MIRLVNQLISRAVETRASDIHLEPVRGRVARALPAATACLQDAEAVRRRGWSAAVISRIKIMARLDIAERRLPQDGRIKLAVRGQEIDLRVSTSSVPARGNGGAARPRPERGHLRLRARSAWRRRRRQRLVQGGARPAERHRAGHRSLSAAARPRPSTPACSSLNSVVRKIITIEDPIEYQLRGINQIQVKPQIGLSFATLLALHPAPGPRRDHGGRDPRPGDRADRRAGGAHRPPGAVHRAHQLGGGHHHPAARHGPRGLPDDGRAARRARPAPGPPPLHRVRAEARPRRRPS